MYYKTKKQTVLELLYWQQASHSHKVKSFKWVIICSNLKQRHHNGKIAVVKVSFLQNLKKCLLIG